jgi:hypothetical protein
MLPGSLIQTKARLSLKNKAFIKENIRNKAVDSDTGSLPAGTATPDEPPIFGYIPPASAADSIAPASAADSNASASAADSIAPASAADSNASASAADSNASASVAVLIPQVYPARSAYIPVPVRSN